MCNWIVRALVCFYVVKSSFALGVADKPIPYFPTVFKQKPVSAIYKTHFHTETLKNTFKKWQSDNL